MSPIQLTCNRQIPYRRPHGAAQRVHAFSAARTKKEIDTRGNVLHTAHRFTRPMPPPDSELGQWFVARVQPHEPELRAFLRRRFPSLRDIDDLVQEAYARLIRTHSAGTIVEPRAYLFSTARNIGCDVFRRRQPISLEDLAEKDRSAVVEEAADAAETASHTQEIDVLVAAIRALPPRCREVVTLRKLHGLSYRDIARRLGISENTVNAQLAIGLVRCRHYLAAHGVVKRGADAC